MQLSPRSQLSLFAEVARQGSIAAGARSLGLTASAAENELKALEARLGHILLDVIDGSICLTPAGARTFEALDMLGEALTTPSPVQKGPSPSSMAPAIRLTLGANPPIFSHLREKLAAFEDSHEDVAIDLDLDCFTVDAARRKIAAGMVDIAYYYALPGEDGNSSVYAWTERLSLFIGAGHELAARDLVSRNDLALTPPLLLRADNPLRQLIGTLMEKAGIGAAPPACESDDYSELLVRVRAGEGFVALFGPLAQQFGAMEGVKKLPFGEILPALDVRRTMPPSDDDAAQILAASLD